MIDIRIIDVLLYYNSQLKDHLNRSIHIYRVIQEDRSVVWRVKISASARYSKKCIRRNICQIVNGDGDTAI